MAEDAITAGPVQWRTAEVAAAAGKPCAVAERLVRVPVVKIVAEHVLRQAM
jgi:hypothetical protein